MSCPTDNTATVFPLTSFSVLLDQLMLRSRPTCVMMELTMRLVSDF